MGRTPASHKKIKKQRSEVKTTYKDVEGIERIIVEDSGPFINTSPDVKVEPGTCDAILKRTYTSTLSKLNIQKLLKHTGNKKKKSAFVLSEASIHTFLRDEPFNISLEMLKDNNRKRICVSIVKKTALNYFSNERNYSTSKYQNSSKKQNTSKRERISLSPTSSKQPFEKSSDNGNIHSNITPFTIDLSSMHVRRYLIEDIMYLNKNNKFLLLVSRDISGVDYWQSIVRQQGTNVPVIYIGACSYFQIQATVIDNNRRNQFVTGGTKLDSDDEEDNSFMNDIAESILYENSDRNDDEVVHNPDDNDVCEALYQMDNQLDDEIEEEQNTSTVEQEMINIEINGKVIKNVTKAKLNRVALSNIVKCGIQKMIDSNITEVRYRTKCRKQRENKALQDELYNDLNKEGARCEVTQFINRLKDKNDRVFNNRFRRSIKNLL